MLSLLAGMMVCMASGDRARHSPPQTTREKQAKNRYRRKKGKKR